MKKTLYMIMLALAFAACTNHPKLPATYETAGSLPDIYPDYTDVVVPPNIAPLNFGIRGNITDCVAQFTLPDNQTFLIDHNPGISWVKQMIENIVG